MNKKYNYQLTSNEAVTILALIRVEINHIEEWIKSCEEDGDDECRMLAEKRLIETRALYNNFDMQHLQHLKIY
ncbi:MAG: hypothetical protein LUC83_09950 [Clostridiales bacterium]|nr:hypothetical protein [Clostridiales bacterium]